MLSAGDLAAIRSDIAGTLPDRCTVIRDALVADGEGGQTKVPTTIDTFDARISPQTERVRSTSELAGGQVTSLVGWLITFGYGTDVRLNDRIRSAREQTLTVSGATGGTLTLTHGAQTTANLFHNAPASAVQAALEALSSISTGKVTVTGGPLNTAPVVISFPSIACKLLVANSGLLGTDATAVIATRIFEVGAVFGPRAWEIDRRVLTREIA